MRDLLSWVAFINVTERSLGPTYALLHGIFLILLDGLSLGMCALLAFYICSSDLLHLFAEHRRS